MARGQLVKSFRPVVHLHSASKFDVGRVAMEFSGPRSCPLRQTLDAIRFGQFKFVSVNEAVSRSQPWQSVRRDLHSFNVMEFETIAYQMARIVVAL